MVGNRGVVTVDEYMRRTNEDTDFHGAKLALFIGGQLAVIRRDDRPGLPWAGMLDMPGGGREGGESPVACVLRETQEELGLGLKPTDLIWRRAFPGPDGWGWFFAARLDAAMAEKVRFGAEGQFWTLMPPRAYVTHPQAIPHFAARVALVLAELP